MSAQDEPNRWQKVSAERLREQMANSLNYVAIYIENSINFLHIGDDRGAEYTLDKLTPHFRQVMDLMAELQSLNANQAKEDFYARQTPARRRPIRPRESAGENEKPRPAPGKAQTVGDEERDEE